MLAPKVCLPDAFHQHIIMIQCPLALVDDPNYVKALQRRAASNERINSWSSLVTAQEGTVLKNLGILFQSINPHRRLHFPS